jgi:hypothetical protein
VKKPRKPSRKAEAGPKSHLLITGKATREEAVEFAEACYEATLRVDPSRVPGRVNAAGAGLVGTQWKQIVEAANPLRPLEWLSVEIVQLKEADKIPTGSGAKTKLATLLEQRMVVAVQARKCSKAISWDSIRARLYEPKLSALLK